jgi:hypothetical protein
MKHILLVLTLYHATYLIGACAPLKSNLSSDINPPQSETDTHFLNDIAISGCLNGSSGIAVNLLLATYENAIMCVTMDVATLVMEEQGVFSGINENRLIWMRMPASYLQTVDVASDLSSDNCDISVYDIESTLLPGSVGRRNLWIGRCKVDVRWKPRGNLENCKEILLTLKGTGSMAWLTISGFSGDFGQGRRRVKILKNHPKSVDTIYP